MTEMPHAANPPETGARDGAILVRLCLLLGEGGGMIASSMALLLPTLPSILASPAATAVGCGDFLLISSCAASLAGGSLTASNPLFSPDDVSGASWLPPPSWFVG